MRARGAVVVAGVVGVIGVVGTLLALAPAPVGAAPTEVAVQRAEPVAWGRCTDRDLRKAGAECGTLVVPLDHAAPTGPTVRLAVSRVLHTREPYRGAVFTNPGGPGGPGLTFSLYGRYVPDREGRNYDWYGLDPRGVGASEPTLTCDGSWYAAGRAPYAGNRAADVRWWKERAAGYAADCADAKAAALLPHLRTVDTVEDFELLRQAIGQPQVTWFGASYGTAIAQLYATRHPAQVRGLFLDGVVDAEEGYYEGASVQARSQQRAIDRFFAWVARNDATYRLGRTAAEVDRRVRAARARLTAAPIGTAPSAAELDDVLVGVAYWVGYWEQTADELAALVRDRDTGPLLADYRSLSPTGRGADNGNAVFLGTGCTDSAFPRSWRTWARDTARTARRAPYTAWRSAWQVAPCRTWPVPAAPAQEPVSGAGATFPVLMYNETYDGITSLRGALRSRQRFPTAVLVEGRGGSSHTVALGGSPCTLALIADFFAQRPLPARKAGNRADVRCAGVPQPVPSARAAAGAGAPRPVVDLRR